VAACLTLGGGLHRADVPFLRRDWTHSVASRPPDRKKLKLSDLARLRPERGSWIDEEIRSGTDRSAALVAAADLDQTLEDVILIRFVDLNLDEHNELFRGLAAPLGTFAAKIRIGYALGIYGQLTRADLLKISQVRNVFAHASVRVDFETEEISDACRSLKCIGEYSKLGFGLGLTYDLDGASPKVLFISTVYSITEALCDHASNYFERQIALLRKLTGKPLGTEGISEDELRQRLLPKTTQPIP
jgi:hypothetical protein